MSSEQLFWQHFGVIKDLMKQATDLRQFTFYVNPGKEIWVMLWDSQNPEGHWHTNRREHSSLMGLVSDMIEAIGKDRYNDFLVSNKRLSLAG